MHKNKLTRAVMDGDVASVTSQLTSLGSMEDASRRQKTFLHALGCAASSGLVEITRVLVNFDPEWARRKRTRDTPIFLLAAIRGHLEVVQVLVESGADLAVMGAGGNTALHEASRLGHLEIVRYLISNGAKVNVKNKDGHTSLMLAAQSGHAEVVRVLLEEGEACVHVLTKTEATALEFVPNDRADIVKLLCQHGVDVNHRDKEKETALTSSLKRRGKMSLELLNCLLLYGADVNIPDRHEQSPLLLAVSCNEEDEIISRLIDAGADPNAANRRGTTPLIQAVWRDRNRVIRLLAEAGANMDACDREGNSAVMIALSRRMDVEIVYLLIELGVDVNTRNHENETALKMAFSLFGMSWFDPALALLQAGAKPPLEDSETGTWMLRRAVRQRETDLCLSLIDSGMKYTQTVHEIVVYSLSDVVERMLCNGGVWPTLKVLEYVPEVYGMINRLPKILRSTPLSPLLAAFVFKNARLVQAFLSISFLNAFDLSWSPPLWSALMAELQRSSDDACVDLALTLRYQPWSLRTLCFANISTWIGFENNRADKLSRTGLPVSLQRSFMFESRLKISELPHSSA
ncbi:ankyrin repeat domain-containing protein 17 [Aplysia californica]|uniref:Ankyrin repeat domain-containing protein 17 n=1 Tax=Aplysia californica TaxID=6500 RepID=A0ABM0JVA8_APLCA|nr:ankyrin repeat domain-containing protein 17 [Aplysia californica]